MADEITLLATAHERAIMSMNLARPSYESDNGRVWGLLQELSKGCPAWSFIVKSSTTRNGREAFKALVVHYEGVAQQSCSKQAAYVIIMFINKLTAAYQVLSDYKQDVAEGKKVRDFLEAIKTPVLDAGKAQHAGERDQLLGTLCQESVHDAMGDCWSRPWRWHWRTCGQGRGRGPGGRGGRGRGRGGGRSAKPTVSARNFEDDEWEQLSPEEQIEGISALCSAADDAADDDGSADEAGTLMKSTPKNKGKGK
eukprot:scaffold3589_cov44-Attheya_sp.AAC.2